VTQTQKLRHRTPEEAYGPSLQLALQSFSGLEPALMAERAAAAYLTDGLGTGTFSVPFLGSVYDVEWPDGHTVRRQDQSKADIATRIILLHYLIGAEGVPLKGKWIAFRNLPGGLGYEGAFRGRAGVRLAAAFGTDRLGFEKAARSLAGEALEFGDSSFLFRVLPRVWLAAILHIGDDEFPAEANVLFEATASHYLPTEDLAVLGGMLTSRLLRASEMA
jgi:hypothetical protein